MDEIYVLQVVAGYIDWPKPTQKVAVMASLKAWYAPGPGFLVIEGHVVVRTDEQEDDDDGPLAGVGEVFSVRHETTRWHAVRVAVLEGDSWLAGIREAIARFNAGQAELWPAKSNGVGPSVVEARS